MTSNDYLGESGKHLFHFVQVTDIHVTHLGHADRMEQFEQFCNEIIKTLIKPPVTIVTGDLVNNAGDLRNRANSLLLTGQFEQEWKIYRDILIRTNVTKYTKWLDIKGNHDIFMDSNPDSTKSFYRMYSHQGHDHSGSYAHTLTSNDGENISFVSVDMCPRPGVGFPFNFFGSLTNQEIQTLQQLSAQTQHSSSTIFFGHYPLSFTYSHGLDQLMKHGLVYLNGHLHSGIKHLYARHSNGLLEIELGDWKTQRRFRIVTIDSGLLSFEDVRFNQSIYAVISNPKAAKFKTTREPLYRLSQSTHIRIMIFARLPIVHVTISIDDQYLGSARRSTDNPNLFVLPWNVSLYHDEKLHQILVQIKDNGSNSITIKHEFSLSLSPITVWNRSKLILTIHQPTFGLMIIISSLSIYILVLVYYRYQAKRRSSNYTNRFSRRMTLLCSVDWIYYSLLTFASYHFIGPWYIGILTKDHIGATFLWGILIQGIYLPPDAQIFAGNFQLYFFLFPLTFNLSSTCYYRYKTLQLTRYHQSRLNHCCRIYTVYILFLYTLLFLLFWSFFITSSYRWAWIISPFSLPLIICTISLYIKTHRLKLDDFQLLSLKKSNEMIETINVDNLKLNIKLEEQSSLLHEIKSQ